MRFQPSFRSLLLAIGLAVAIRTLAVCFAPSVFSADPDAYQAISQTINESGVFGLTSPQGLPRPIAFRPPLYPWILSWCVFDGRLSANAVATLHILLAALTACFVFCTTVRLVESSSFSAGHPTATRLGFVAAVLTAIDPILLRQSTEVMTETLAATLTAAVIWFWCKWEDGMPRRNTLAIRAGPLGTSLALAYLCRPTFLVWAVLLIAAAVVRMPNRRGMFSAALIASIVAVAVAGWTARNARTFGHPIWATTHGGYTLLLANNDSFYRYLSQGQFGQPWDASQFLNAFQHRYEGDPRQASFWQRDWDGEPTYEGGVSEYEDDRLCYESAVATIKRQPTLFGWSAVVRVARLWNPFPHDVPGRSRTFTTIVGCFYVLIYVAVLVTVIRHRQIVFGRRWWAIWLLAVTLTCVHAVYWSNLRMRAPAMPAIMILAALAVTPRCVSDQRHEREEAGS